MTWTLILACVIIGLLLVVVEVIFIPGTTVIGFLGVGAVFTGIFFSYEVYGSTTGNLVLISTIGLSTITVYLINKYKLWNIFALKESSSSRVAESDFTEFKMGDIGETITDLRPFGEIKIGEKTIEAESFSGYIKAQTKIEVVQVNKHNLIVKPL